MKKKADHPHNRKGSQIMKLQYNKDTFLLDGKPFRILSGAIHYFRVPQAYWELPTTNAYLSLVFFSKA